MDTYILICDIAYGTEEQYNFITAADNQEEAIMNYEANDNCHDKESIDIIIKVEGTPPITETVNFASNHSSYPERTQLHN